MSVATLHASKSEFAVAGQDKIQKGHVIIIGLNH